MNAILPGPRDFAAYIHRIRYSIYAVAALMAFSLLIGVAIALTLPGPTDQLMKLLSQEFLPFKSMASLDLMISLFLHNALICLLMLGLGLALGVLTLFIAFDNGLMIGLAGTATASKAGLLYTLAAILPHGIVEVPVMVLSAAIGLHLGYSVLLSLIRRPVDLRQEIADALGVYAVWLLPLLLLAAFLESYVTTAIVYYLLH